MKTNKKMVVGLMVLMIVTIGSSLRLKAQDDLYYMPSKQPANDSKKQPKLSVDTTGMTDYEKYRALRDADTFTVANRNVADTSIDREEYAKKKGMERYKDAQVIDTNQVQYENPNYSEQSPGETTVINNYYSDDDYDYRFNRYRSFYFDYYDPYYWRYDPFYWNCGIGFGWPYSSFYFGWSSPYYGWYDPYDYYFYRPLYWYQPYYHSYWGGYGYWHGYYNGYYHGYYDDNYYGRGSVHSYSNGRRTMGLYNRPYSSANANSYVRGGNYGTSFGSRRQASDYLPLNSTKQNTVNDSHRRNAWDTYSTPASSSRRNSSNTSRVINNVQTTRPAEAGGSRRTSGNYTPTYSMPNTSSRPSYNNSGSGSNSNTNRRTNSTYTPSDNNSGSGSYTPTTGSRRSSGSSGSYTPTRSSNTNSGNYSAPRRSNDSYTPPARTRSESNESSGSRRSSGSSYSGSSSSGSNYSGSSSGGGSRSSSSSGGSSGGGRRR